MRYSEPGVASQLQSLRPVRRVAEFELLGRLRYEHLSYIFTAS
jgi:hypothetical protein